MPKELVQFVDITTKKVILEPSIRACTTMKGCYLVTGKDDQGNAASNITNYDKAVLACNQGVAKKKFK